MRLPTEWIREYAGVDVEAEELARTLTMAGLEVEETEDSAVGPVVNITVTPNRGDCLSVIGVAREVAAAYETRLADVPCEPSLDEGEAPQFTAVAIEDTDLCPRYAAR